MSRFDDMLAANQVANTEQLVKDFNIELPAKLDYSIGVSDKQKTVSQTTAQKQKLIAAEDAARANNRDRTIAETAQDLATGIFLKGGVNLGQSAYGLANVASDVLNPNNYFRDKGEKRYSLDQYLSERGLAPDFNKTNAAIDETFLSDPMKQTLANVASEDAQFAKGNEGRIAADKARLPSSTPDWFLDLNEGLRTVGDTAKTLYDNPSAAIQTTAESLGYLTGGKAAAQLGEAVLKKGITKATAGAAGAGAFGMGAEGGSAAVENAKIIKDADVNDLKKTSKRFNVLLKNGYSEDNAKLELASEEMKSAGLKAAVVTGVTNKLFGSNKAIAGLNTKTSGIKDTAKKLLNVAKEGPQEFFEEGGTQYAQNQNKKANIDATQKLSEGVVAAGTKGAVSGLASPGSAIASSAIEKAALNAPKAAVESAKIAANTAKGLANLTGKAIKGTPGAIKATADLAGKAKDTATKAADTVSNIEPSAVVNSVKEAVKAVPEAVSSTIDKGKEFASKTGDVIKESKLITKAKNIKNVEDVDSVEEKVTVLTNKYNLPEIEATHVEKVKHHMDVAATISGISAEFNEKVAELDRLTEQDPSNPQTELNAELDKLESLNGRLMPMLEAAEKAATISGDTLKAAVAEAEQAKTPEATAEAVDKVFGSRPVKASPNEIKGFKATLKNPNISSEHRTKVENYVATQEAITEATGKATTGRGVHEQVINGFTDPKTGKFFNGVTQFQKDVQRAIEGKSERGTKAAVANMHRFTSRQVQKLQDIQAILNDPSETNIKKAEDKYGFKYKSPAATQSYYNLNKGDLDVLVPAYKESLNLAEEVSPGISKDMALKSLEVTSKAQTAESPVSATEQANTTVSQQAWKDKGTEHKEVMDKAVNAFDKLTKEEAKTVPEKTQKALDRYKRTGELNPNATAEQIAQINDEVSKTTKPKKEEASLESAASNTVEKIVAKIKETDFKGKLNTENVKDSMEDITSMVTEHAKEGKPTTQGEVSQLLKGMQDASNGTIDSSNAAFMHKKGAQLAHKLNTANNENVSEEEIASYNLSGNILKGGMSTKTTSAHAEQTMDDWAKPNKDKSASVLHNLPDFFKNLVQYLPSLNLNDDQKIALDFMQKFNGDFTDAFMNKAVLPIGEVTNKAGAKLKPYAYNERLLGDMAQFFGDENGNYDSNYLSTMAMEGLNWVSTRAEETLSNSPDKIRAILHMRSDEELPNRAFNLLNGVGMSRAALFDSLGSNVLRALELTFNKDIPGEIRPNIQTSLGQHMYYTLYHMGYIEQTTGIKNSELFALTGVIPKNADAESTFVRVKADSKDNDSVHPRVQEAINIIKGYQDEKDHKGTRIGVDLMKELFATESFESFPELVSPKEVADTVKNSFKKLPIKIRKFLAKKQKEKNYIKLNQYAVYSEMPYEDQLLMEGYVHDLTKVQASRREEVKSKNAAIKKGVDALHQFVQILENEEKGIQTPFYYKQMVSKNMRNLTSGNMVNSQQNKVVRHLTNLEGSKVTIDPTKDAQLLQEFKAAVGVAFGLKAEEKSNAEIADFFGQLTDPNHPKYKEEVGNAVAAAKRFINGEYLTVAEREQAHKDIMEAVDTGGEATWSFDGIVSLAEYRADNPFTSTLFREVDGITNGVIIGLMQLVAAENWEGVKDMLASGGIFDSVMNGGYAEFKAKGGKDNYVTTTEDMVRSVEAISNAIVNNEKQTLSKDDKKAAAKFRKDGGNAEIIEASNFFVGELISNEGVTSIGRNLVKYPLMIASYGGSLYRIIEEFGNTIFDNFYLKIEKAVNNHDQEELNTIAKHMNTMLGENSNIELNLKTAMKFQFPFKDRDKLEKVFKTHIKNLYGTPLKNAIESKFSTFMEKRTDMNNALNLVFFIFNKRLNTKIETFELDNNRKISEEEKLAMVIELQKYMPSFAGYLSDGEYETEISPMKDKKIRSLDTAYEQTSTMREPFANGEKSTKGRASTRQFEAPGLAGVILGIHSIDAATMMQVLMQYEGLNVHDAIGFSLSDAINGSEAFNKIFIETMTNYSIRDSISQTLDRVWQDLTKEEIATLDKEISSTPTTDNPSIGVGFFKKKDKNLTPKYDSVLDFVTEFALQSAIDRETKSQWMSKIQSSFQYSHGGDGLGGYYPDGKPAPIVENIGSILSNEVRTKGRKKTSITVNQAKVIIEAQTVADAYMVDAKELANMLSERLQQSITPKIIQEVVKGKRNIFTNRPGEETLIFDINNEAFTELKTKTGLSNSEVVPDIIDTSSDNIDDTEEISQVPQNDAMGQDEPIGDLPTNLPMASGTDSNGPEDTFNSAPNSAINIDTYNADRVKELTASNVLETFNDLEGRGITDSSEHKAHLSSLISNIIQKVIKPIQYMEGTVGTITEGITGKGKLIVNIGSATATDGTVESPQTIMAHELLHATLNLAIDDPSNSTTMRQVRKLYDEVASKIEPFDLLEVPLPQATLTQRKVAEERYDHIFNNKDGHGLHEFISVGATNEHFIGLLNQMDRKSNEPKAKGFWNRLKQLTNKLVDSVFKRVSTKNINKADKELMALIEQLAEIETRAERSMFDANSFLDMADVKIVKAAQDWMLAPMNKLLRSDRARQSKNNLVSIASSVSMAAKYLSTTHNILTITKGAQAATKNLEEFIDTMGEVAHRMGITEKNLVSQLIVELRGETLSNAAWTDLLAISNKLIDQTRAKLKSGTASHLLSKFSTVLDKTQEMAMTKAVLKTDLASIASLYSVSQLGELLGNEAYSRQELADAYTSLDQFGSTAAHYFKSYAKALGIQMATGEITEGNQMDNAHRIAYFHSLQGEGVPRGIDNEAAKLIIDKVATLEALNHTSKIHKLSARDTLLRENAVDPTNNGFTYTIELHDLLKRQALERNFAGQEAMMGKGFIQEILDPNISFEVAPLAMEEELKKNGYTRQEIPITKDKRDVNNSEPMYMYIANDGRVNTWLKMVVSLTSKTAKGTNLVKVRSQQGSHDPYTEGLQDGQTVYNRYAVLAKKQLSGADTSFDPNEENILSPIYDNEGNITAYRYRMNEVTKDSLLKKDNSFANIMGTMHGNIEDKVSTEYINNQVVQTAKADYDENYSKRPELFTAIGLNVKDKDYRELYQMMPQDMRDEVAKVWREDKMYIRKNLVNDVFGYRKLSITQIERLNTPWIKKAENIIQETMKVAKDAIVIKTGAVFVDNVTSNTAQLAIEKLSPKEILYGQVEGLDNLLRYIKDHNELGKISLDLEVQTTIAGKRKLEARKANLESYIKANPVMPLIDSGQFQTILEDIDTTEADYTYRSTLDRFIASKTGGIPDSTKALIKKIGQEVMIGHDTELYKLMRDMTQYSDFVARYALHKHNMDKTSMSEEESLRYIRSTFINYDLSTPPLIQYLNDMGLMAFTKFFFRTQRIVARNFIKAPSRLLGLYGLEEVFGDIPDITDTGFNPINRVYNPAAFIWDASGLHIKDLADYAIPGIN